MTIQERNEAVKWDVDALISAKAKDFNLGELEELEFDDSKYVAVRIIAANLRDTGVTDYAIKRCLQEYEKNKNSLFGLESHPPLNTATQLVYYSASKEMIGKVIFAVAESGWYGRIEDLAQKTLGRGLTVAEVTALVEHFVKQRGMIAGHRKIWNMVTNYVSKELRGELYDKINRRVDDFNKADCY